MKNMKVLVLKINILEWYDTPSAEEYTLEDYVIYVLSQMLILCGLSTISGRILGPVSI